MEEKNKKQQEDEFAIFTKQQLQKDLVVMIAKINEINEVCQNLGRYTYMYEPCIVTEIQANGQRVPKVCCKAYPDRENNFHNVLSQNKFEDVYFQIKEKWEF